MVTWSHLMNPNSYIGQDKPKTSFFFYVLVLESESMF